MVLGRDESCASYELAMRHAEHGLSIGATTKSMQFRAGVDGTTRRGPMLMLAPRVTFQSVCSGGATGLARDEYARVPASADSWMVHDEWPACNAAPLGAHCAAW